MKYPSIKCFMYGGTQPEMQDYLYCAENSPLFVLADGSGTDGAKASQTAVFRIVNEFSSRSAADIQTVSSSLMLLNDEIRSLDGNASLAFLQLQGQRLITANLGETKIFIFRDDKLAFATEGELNMGSLGQAEVLPECLVKQSVWNLQQGDAVLLCTCGFWKKISPLEMEADLLKSKQAEDWVQYMVCRILMKLGKNEQADNLSVIALVFRV